MKSKTSPNFIVEEKKGLVTHTNYNFIRRALWGKKMIFEVKKNMYNIKKMFMSNTIFALFLCAIHGQSQPPIVPTQITYPSNPRSPPPTPSNLPTQVISPFLSCWILPPPTSGALGQMPMKSTGPILNATVCVRFSVNRTYTYNGISNQTFQYLSGLTIIQDLYGCTTSFCNSPISPTPSIMNSPGVVTSRPSPTPTILTNYSITPTVSPSSSIKSFFTTNATTILTTPSVTSSPRGSDL